MKDLERFYEQNYRMMRYYVYQHGGGSWTEDIVQEIFLTALQKWQEVKAHENQIGWLKLTAGNKIQEYWRRFPGGELLLEDDWRLGRVEEDYGLLEWKMTVKNRMNRRDSELFLDFYLYGISISALAKRENTNEAALRVKLCRLKNKLKSDVIKHKF